MMVPIPAPHLSCSSSAWPILEILKVCSPSAQESVTLPCAAMTYQLAGVASATQAIGPSESTEAEKLTLPSFSLPVSSYLVMRKSPSKYPSKDCASSTMRHFFDAPLSAQSRKNGAFSSAQRPPPAKL